jgi:hypothetical protein
MLRAIDEADAPEIVQAFERLTADSRYYRFMQHKRQLDPAALERGVHPRPGRDFAFVATIPATDGIDIVGAAQYVRRSGRRRKSCEFAITVAEDWRHRARSQLLASLVRRRGAMRYRTMEGSVIADNARCSRWREAQIQRAPGAGGRYRGPGAARAVVHTVPRVRFLALDQSRARSPPRFPVSQRGRATAAAVMLRGRACNHRRRRR